MTSVPYTSGLLEATHWQECTPLFSRSSVARIDRDLSRPTGNDTQFEGAGQATYQNLCEQDNHPLYTTDQKVCKIQYSQNVELALH